MSQEQPRRPQAGGGGDYQEKAVKYGDVFNVSGELASELIAPGDAAMMQSAETTMIGKTVPSGPAATMQSAATYNERAGVIGHIDFSDSAAKQGITITETDFPGGRIISESVGGQMIGQYVVPGGGDGERGEIGNRRSRRGGDDGDYDVGDQRGDVGDQRGDAITIGEALEASALTVGDKPVDKSDAAAIQAAEVRATGSNVITPGGVAAAAQSAANANARLMRDEDKYNLADVLTDATVKLPADKPATRGDAEGVMSAELRNNPNLATHPGGVAASVVAAARLNQQEGA